MPEPAPLPSVSVLTPTLNSARTLAECLASVRAQDYPADRLQIVVADAGSSDDTPAIARSFGAEVVPNPLRTGEAGKSAALARATGDLILLLDSDNVLPDPGWLRRMVAPFADPAVFAAEPLRYESRPSDPALTRYFALLGMNDPLCLFVGNYDRLCAITGRWTGLRVPAEQRAGWLALDLSPGIALPPLGANGTLLRRSVLVAVTAPYYFDIDVVQQLVAAGHSRFAKVDTGIVHLYAARLRDFSRKQRRRIRDFLHFRKKPDSRTDGHSDIRTSDKTGDWKPETGNVSVLRTPGHSDSRTFAPRTYSWRRSGALRGVLLFSAATATVLPLLIQMLLGAIRRPDRAWWYHIPVCWTTLLQYASAVLAAPFRPSAPVSRADWQRN